MISRKLIAPQIFAATTLFGLTSCSGGGGGSTSSPPPPPTNSAPSITVSVDASTPDEGQPFIIDASGTTDADGDALTFSIVQLSGPNADPAPASVVLPAANGAFAFAAPDVAADATLMFELTASDGVLSASQTVTVTATNIVLGPEINVFSAPMAEFSGLLSPVEAIFYANNSSVSNIGIAGVEMTADQTQRSIFRFGYDVITEQFDTKTEIVAQGISPAGKVSSAVGEFLYEFSSNLALAFEADNSILVLRREQPQTTSFSVDFTLVEDAPCAIRFLDEEIYDGLLVASRNGGLHTRQSGATSSSTMGNQIGFPVIETLASSGQLCSLYTSSQDTDNVYAVDEDTGLLRIWERPDTRASFVELSSIDPSLPNGLTLVGYAGFGSDMTFSGAGRNFGMHVFAVTDGQHDGDHRLIVLNNEYQNGGAMQRREYTWTKGVPSGVLFTDPFDNTITGPREIIVPLETAPYAVIVQNSGNVLQGDAAPILGPLQYAPLPLGVSGMLRPNMSFNPSRFWVTITQPIKGQVSLIQILPEHLR